MNKLIAQQDCLPVAADITNKIMVLRPTCLGSRYQRAKWQLVRVTGGFGCKASCIGTKCFGEYLADGDDYSGRRSDFLGEATEAMVAEAALDTAAPDAVDPTNLLFMAIGAGAWGKGATIGEAKAKCKQAGGAATVVFHCHAETSFDGFTLTWPRVAPAAVEVWTKPARKARKAKVAA